MKKYNAPEMTIEEIAVVDVVAASGESVPESSWPVVSQISVEDLEQFY